MVPETIGEVESSGLNIQTPYYYETSSALRVRSGIDTTQARYGPLYCELKFGLIHRYIQPGRPTSG